MNLGAFSLSLSVKDLNKSKAFYEQLGFEVSAGEFEHNYLIMKNKKHVIGLFQGMFEGNLLTFNPGWDQDCNTLASFDDVRVIAKKMKDHGIETESEALDTESGPGSFSMRDPDGNIILIDQHV